MTSGPMDQKFSIVGGWKMDIVRITIKGESGYCPIDEAFSDKVTITESLMI